MSTLADIEKAIPQLSAEELAKLERFVQQAKRAKTASQTISVLDMAPLDLGRVLGPLGIREDWYDEMLEGRV